MTQIFFVHAETVHARLNEKLAQSLGYAPQISATAAGKPYIEGNPVYFSLSHSGTRGMFALSDGPVGVDLEILKKRERTGVLNRFGERERAEIACERDFLKHWTAREAYVKLFGLEIAKMWRRLEFFGGELFFDGQKTNAQVRFYDLYYGVAAVCRGGNL